MIAKQNLKGFFHQPINKKKLIVGVSSVVIVALAGTTLALLSTGQDKVKAKDDNAPSKAVVKQNEKVEKKVEPSHVADANKTKKNQISKGDSKPNPSLHSKSAVSSKTESAKPTASVPSLTSESSSSSKTAILAQGEKKPETPTTSNKKTIVSSPKTEPTETLPSSTIPAVSESSPTNSQPSHSSTYLSSSKARQLLESSPYYKKVENEYFYEDEWGYVVDVKINEDNVGFIFFDGTTYYSAKNTTYEDVLAYVKGDQTQADAEWQNLQTIVSDNEKAVQLAADAVYGPETKESKALYQEILEGGKSTKGYFGEF